MLHSKPMKLKKIADIQSGYISRKRIDPDEAGSHYLLQAKDVDGDCLSYEAANLIRFKPALSAKDWVLTQEDVLFMARGVNTFSVLINSIPENTLAAACFFIVRVTAAKVLSEYICWYLNQSPAQRYFEVQSARSVHMPVVRRAVLEGIDIPILPIETQKKIVGLDQLMRQEQGLLSRLAKQRKALLSAACLRAIHTKK